MKFEDLPWEVKLTCRMNLKFKRNPTEEEIEKLLEERLDLKKLVIKHMMREDNDKKGDINNGHYSAISHHWSIR